MTIFHAHRAHYVHANKRRENGASLIRLAPLRRDEFVDMLVPWLIGVPISLIIIRVFSL